MYQSDTLPRAWFSRVCTSLTFCLWLMWCLSLAPCKGSAHVCPLYQSIMTFLLSCVIFKKGKQWKLSDNACFPPVLLVQFFSLSVGWVGTRQDWASWKKEARQAIWVTQGEGMASKTPCCNSLPGQHRLLFRSLFREPHSVSNIFKQLPSSLKKPITNNQFWKL